MAIAGFPPQLVDLLLVCFWTCSLASFLAIDEKGGKKRHSDRASDLNVAKTMTDRPLLYFCQRDGDG